MMCKLSAQMQQLLDASHEKSPPSSLVRSAPQAVLPPSVAGTQEAVESPDVAGTSRTEVIEKVREGKKEEQSSQGRSKEYRSESPQLACPTPERPRPTQQHLQRQDRSAGGSSTSDIVLAKIHALAVLLDGAGLDAAIVDLQKLQQQARHSGAGTDPRQAGTTPAPPVPQLCAPPTAHVPTLCGRMKLAQTKRTGLHGGGNTGSKMFESCPDMSAFARLRHTLR